MNYPPEEIEGVIVRLCTANRKDQEETLKQYFTNDASFFHPFCSVKNNRDKVIRIYQWYKILSPKIEVSVDAVAYDQQKAILFANVSQTFKIRFIPNYVANVKLTAVLHLVETINGEVIRKGSDGISKFLIQSQEDLYQTTEFVKFFLPWNIGTTIVGIWQYFATMFCVYGAAVYIFIAKLLFGQTPARGSVAQEPSTDVGNMDGSNASKATKDDLRRDSGRDGVSTDGHGSVAGMSILKKRGKSVAGPNEGADVGDLERKSNLGQTK